MFEKFIKKNKFSDYLYKTALFVATVVLIVAFFPKDYKFRYNFTEGKPWMYEDLFAPFGFPISKQAVEIDAEINKIIKESHLYFVYNKSLAETQKNKLSKKLNEIQPPIPEKVKAICFAIFDSIYLKGIIQYHDVLENKKDDYNIYVVKDNIAEKRMLKDVYNLRTAFVFLQKELQKKHINGQLVHIMENALSPNIFYDKDITYREQLQRIREISTTRGYVQKNERIISKGEVVNASRYQVLQSLKNQYEGNETDAKRSFILILLGQTILISIAIVMLVFFLNMFRKDLLADNKKTLLILSIIVLMVLTTSILIRLTGYDYIYALPLCIVPLMIRIFFDTRLALFVHLITIIIIGFLVPNGFEFIFLQLIAGIVTIISNVQIERRSQFFITAVYIFITYSLIYIGMTLMQSGGLNEINSKYFLFFTINASLTLVAYPLILIYEKIFGYVTNVSLLEYSNTNNRLLRELSLHAPGTFQHSLQVANLAEEAAHRIGANALMVRAGAMFHDIGKAVNPTFFIENQMYGINPHEKLSIQESAAIITGHVDKGVELAKKHNIPEQIIDFIKTHHGTRRTEYFYKLYKMQKDVVLPEDIFYYKGPCPFSKETAIVMMADSVEAATRSLNKPDKQSIDEFVDRIIDGLIEQKQLKNANITMKDITRVKSVFKNRLMSVHHARLEYPK